MGEKGSKVSAKPKIELRSIVATTELGSPIDLKEIEKKAPKKLMPIYFPEFPGKAWLHLKRPNASFTLFRDGKVECAGCQRERDIKIAITKLVDILRKLGIVASQREPEITIEEFIYGTRLDEEIDNHYEKLYKTFQRVGLGRATGGRFEAFLIAIEGGIIKAEGKEIIARGFKDREKAIKAIEKVIAVVHD